MSKNLYIDASHQMKLESFLNPNLQLKNTNTKIKMS